MSVTQDMLVQDPNMSIFATNEPAAIGAAQARWRRAYQIAGG